MCSCQQVPVQDEETAIDEQGQDSLKVAVSKEAKTRSIVMLRGTRLFRRLVGGINDEWFWPNNQSCDGIDKI